MEAKPVVPLSVAKEIADIYEELEHTPKDPQVRKAYTALQEETHAQFEFAQAHGYTFEPYYGEGQPYETGTQLLYDARINKKVVYYPSSRGFGPIDEPRNEDHPMLEEAQGIPYNDMFRAVHDLYGHTAGGHDIIAQGEFAAFRRHIKMFSEEAIPALFTETVVQACWLEVGPKRTFQDDEYVYPQQKAAILSEEDLKRFLKYFRSDCELHESMPLS